MVMTNKNIYVNGSSAFNVDYLPKRKDEKHKELEDLRREHLKRKRKEQLALKARVVGSIALTFMIGYGIVYRYSFINRLEKNIIETKIQISSINESNEDLRIQLLKYKNISFIEDYGVNELNMIAPNFDTRAFTDLNKDNFINTTEDNINVEGSFIHKLKSIFY